MRLTICLLLLALPLSADSFEYRRAADDPATLALLQGLGLKGALQLEDREVAAFIVRAADGSLSCIPWQHSAAARSEVYRGAIPVGTVAIAHTHPLYAPKPSRGDTAQAKRIGLPIYVITRWNLAAVDPESGETVMLIENRNWTR